MRRAEKLWQLPFRGTANSRGRTLSLVLLTCIILAVLPEIFGGQGELTELGFVVLFALLAYSVAIPFRYVGIMVVAQGSVWMVGAYTGALLLKDYHLSSWLAFPSAAAAGAVAAVIVGGIGLRSKGQYFLILGLAINELLVLVANNVGFTGGESGLLNLSNPNALGPVSFNSPMARYELYVVILLIGMAVYALVETTRFGWKLAAIRENETLARSINIPTARLKLEAIAIGGALAGLAGVIYSYQLEVITPSLFDVLSFLQVVLMVIIGGVNSTLGPLLGAAIFIVLPDHLAFSATTTEIVFGAVLVVVVIAAPEGIAGAVGLANRTLVRRLLDRRRAPAAGAVDPVSVGSTAAVGLTGDERAANSAWGDR
jgi:branched-chain amino acid transport system permease protein